MVEKSLAHHAGLEMLQTGTEQTGVTGSALPLIPFQINKRDAVQCQETADLISLHSQCNFLRTNNVTGPIPSRDCPHDKSVIVP